MLPFRTRTALCSRQMKDSQQKIIGKGMTGDSDTIEQLVARLRKGDDAALGDLYAHYHDRLKRIVQFRMDYRVAGRVSASDVIQESYINAAKRIQHFRDKPEMPFFVWLRLVMNQQLADLHRQHVQAEKRDVRKEISLERRGPSPHTSLAIAAHLAGRETSPSRAFSRVERIATLEAALNKMEPIDREVIALRHFEELTNSEVSAVLNIGEQAASKRYVRAIKRMRQVLDEVPGFTMS